jgi:hypothetical protein
MSKAKFFVLPVLAVISTTTCVASDNYLEEQKRALAAFQRPQPIVSNEERELQEALALIQAQESAQANEGANSNNNVATEEEQLAMILALSASQADKPSPKKKDAVQADGDDEDLAAALRASLAKPPVMKKPLKPLMDDEDQIRRAIQESLEQKPTVIKEVTLLSHMDEEDLSLAIRESQAEQEAAERQRKLVEADVHMDEGMADLQRRLVQIDERYGDDVRAKFNARLEAINAEIQQTTQLLGTIPYTLHELDEIIMLDETNLESVFGGTKGFGENDAFKTKHMAMLTGINYKKSMRATRVEYERLLVALNDLKEECDAMLLSFN